MCAVVVPTALVCERVCVLCLALLFPAAALVEASAVDLHCVLDLGAEEGACRRSNVLFGQHRRSETRSNPFRPVSEPTFHDFVRGQNNV